MFPGTQSNAIFKTTRLKFFINMGVYLHNLCASHHGWKNLLDSASMYCDTHLGDLPD